MQGILEEDLTDSKVKGAEPNTGVGLMNPANSGLKDPGWRNDPEPVHYPSQNSRGDGSSRVSRVWSWKRRARKVNEPQSIATSKIDVRKRKAEGQGRSETSDTQEGIQKRQRDEAAQEGSDDHCEAEATVCQGWNFFSEAQEGSMIR
ncbi:hypothetical protein U1Q18_047609 [Sarracenia purpurea var. burkii]